jgi:hypothetical protein
MNLLTSSGRIPKKKWFVMRRSDWRVISRHQFKSAALDKALLVASKTGQKYALCVIAMHGGEPVLVETDFIGPENFSRR